MPALPGQAGETPERLCWRAGCRLKLQLTEKVDPRAVLPAFFATLRPGLAARCSQILKTVSAASGEPSAVAISAADRLRPLIEHRWPTIRPWRARTAAAAFLPASTPGW